MPAVKPSRRTPSKRQKIQRPSRQGLGARRSILFIVTMGCFVCIMWVYFHASALVLGTVQSFEKSMANVGFTLEDVVVEGRIRTDKSDILKKLELKRGVSLLAINLSEAKAKLEAIPWVKAVCVERRLPDTLFIRMSEKDPVALWQNQAKTYLVDRDGEIVEIQDPYKYKALLIITGEKAPLHVRTLVTLLDKFPEIKARVTAATHLRASRWDIRLDGKVDVKLPEKEAERALSYLIDLEKHHQLSDKEVMTIDMRLPDQLILRLTPEAAQKKNNVGKDA